jgi:hypothetical protein
VSVDGAPVEVDGNGRFSVEVPRTAGKKEAHVTLRDAAGRVETKTVRCLDGDARIRDFAIHWGRRPQ